MAEASVWRLYVAAALLLSASACGDPVSPTPQQGLTITTSRPSYTAGDVIVVTIANRGVSILHDACGGMELQQLVGQGWHMQASRGCLLAGRDTIVTLVPGAVWTDSLATAPAFPHGTYRVLYDLRSGNEASLPEAVRASNSFTLQ